MPDADLLRRIEMLENTVESLRQLPADVARLSRRMGRAESQILQLRTEIRDEFSGIRRDMATKADLAAGLNAVRAEMATKAGLSGLRVEFNDGIAGAVRELTGAIAETRTDLKGLADAQRRTTVLVEDAIDRLKTIAEGNPPLSG